MMLLILIVLLLLCHHGGRSFDGGGGIRFESIIISLLMLLLLGRLRLWRSQLVGLDVLPSVGRQSNIPVNGVIVTVLIDLQFERALHPNIGFVKLAVAAFVFDIAAGFDADGPLHRFSNRGSAGLWQPVQIPRPDGRSQHGFTNPPLVGRMEADDPD